MRSISLTLLLAIVAVITAGLAGMRLSEGSLARVFGVPPTPIGEDLYDFDPSEVQEIYLLGNGFSAHCRKDPSGWQMVKPWRDRMDPRAAQAIFQFALNAKVEGAIPREKVESAGLQFDDGQIGFGFVDAEGETISKFILGRRTAWLGTDTETGDTIPTVFVEPRDKGRKDYLYACVDPNDIHGLLKGGFNELRDHHPFLFHPTIVESLRVKNRTGEMLLSREHPKELWSIVKPLGLKSDRAALVSLLQGLYDLKAVKVMNRSEVTLPTEEPQGVEVIALKFFGASEEITLEIYPPQEPDATSVLAKVSNRPDTIFELPLASIPDPNGGKDRVGLNQLPLSVNALRDPTLTSIDNRSLKSILISPTNEDAIILQRAKPEDRFSILLNGRIEEPSETALFALLKTVTEAKVAAFVSDTATDLTPYGLDEPFLILRFSSFNGDIIQLSFGQPKDGDVHVIREGTTTVVKVDPSMLTLIPTRPWDWRELQVWRIAPPDVMRIERVLDSEAPLNLACDYNKEKWTATQGGEDLSLDLVKNRADLLRKNLLDLKATAWLRPEHTAAAKALRLPTIVISLFSKQFDQEANFKGLQKSELVIGQFKNAEDTVYYGQLKGDKNPFLLTKEIAEALAADLFEIEHR